MRPLVLFDLDNTLIDRLDAFRTWVAEFAAGRGLPGDAAQWMITLDADGSMPMNAFFEAVRDRFALPEPAEALWLAYRARLPELVVCRPETLSALAGLREAGHPIGIVTNGMTDNQTGKITTTGLDAYADGWAISDAEGIRKPDPRLLEIAASRCGASPVGGWMIGDDPVNDISAGQAAGMGTIWIDRGGPWPAGRPRPDHVARDAATAARLVLGHDTFTG
ncbi:HAD family hydrolase [Nonomuraea sp. NBC_01738]|uniref:HAD family hydrolase n=1 Tax=Nonomuraea sp. NBC_01738 TaxID=2976003 RepID=UPI002E12981E|nr:HAD family hydrolase [Nonomuraea sp. NBC_01738]